MSFDDHPLRYALTNELHARPFPSLAAPGPGHLPCHQGTVASRQARPVAGPGASDRASGPVRRATPDAGRDALLRRSGQVPSEVGTAYGVRDLHRLRARTAARPFDPAAWEVFPEDWLAEIPGARITSAHLIYQPAPEDEAEIEPMIHEWFVPESLAVSRVLDDTAVIAGDFRIDSTGHLRFAIFSRPDTGHRLWAASCSASARSRPTRPCRCWACRGRVRSRAIWGRSTSGCRIWSAT
jgi:hypothetical protein